ncbi:MAG: transcriptional regulator [Verrucomicrobiales bacterium]|nr:transcriptional regulator [Verrucomicrobiales bacterium]
MSQTLKILRALGDPTRLRLLALLESEVLSVNELQSITGLGQSRISTHLGLLQETGLVNSQRDGKRSLYQLNPSPANRASFSMAQQAARETDDYASDQAGLRRILEQRNNAQQVFFNQVAGRFDRRYGPGRSWQAFGQFLLRVLPPLDIADLGSGEGLLAELLARRARKVICVDNSKRIVDFGTRKAKKNGLKNIKFRQGDIESPPIRANTIDLALFSQALHHAEHPAAAIIAAHKILRPGGQVMILDLREHNQTDVASHLGDRWPGFSETQLHEWLATAGFNDIEVTEVAREEEPPHFQTLLATGTKPA